MIASLFYNIYYFCTINNIAAPVNELYNILCIFTLNGLLLAIGLMLLFTAIPDSPLLGNYRKARYMMAAAYLFFAFVNFLEYLFGSSVSDVPLLRTITLAIAASQAFMFTFAMLALLETRFPGWRAIFREGIPAILLIFAVFIVYAACPETCFGIAFYFFLGIYTLLLARYTYLFIRNYRRFRRRMDNWFSGNEADRLRWVAFSFFAALGIGVMALCSTVFMSAGVALAFALVVEIFYTFFAIRFINYTYRFYVIEAAMEADAPEIIARQHDSDIFSPAVVRAIETGLKSWTDDKGFLRPGVTLGDVARHVGTNNKYLSIYINHYLGRTFREWIGALRIDEAKRLMLEEPDTTLAGIASRTGFSTKSHFGQQFRSLVGSSPSAWREQNARMR